MMGKKNNDSVAEKPRFSENQKQTLKKYAVYSFMVLLFLGVIFLIFQPDLNETDTGEGLNTELPAPQKVVLVDNKKDAYEQENLKNKQNRKIKTLNNFALLTSGLDTVNSNRETEEYQNNETERRADLGSIHPANPVPHNPIVNSAHSYRGINEDVSCFYSTSNKESEDVRDLKKQVEELKELLQNKDKSVNRLEEQAALMEKSYELAAKYFPDPNGEKITSIEPKEKHPQEIATKPINLQNKTRVSVMKIKEDIVTSLCQPVSDLEFIEFLSKERNIGFISPEEKNDNTAPNAIEVCIDSKQTFTNGQNVNLRLCNSIKAGEIVIPENFVLAGTGNIRGDRLYIDVSSFEYNGIVIKVDLHAYDLKGLQGIYIPDIDEVNAVKEIAANMGGNLGTGISVNHNAGQQLAGDLGKSLIQGTSQYVQKKIRAVKVNLKAGYRLFLVSDSI